MTAGFSSLLPPMKVSRAEGHHKNQHSPLLIIIDEAKSVGNDIFQAFDRCSFNVQLLIARRG